ncbi:hypothetical protein CDEST_01350 [Colletotrichum destructivum]|uniref:Uncharacterized protein n=1 Tax=Colletotrichum destructivum TaxID=34406 RepID=A0AAX4HZM9_9PEZI|nr:hypothetical protein CDEST_01350 [Colletotrichum destructivum]
MRRKPPRKSTGVRPTGQLALGWLDGRLDHPQSSQYQAAGKAINRREQATRSSGPPASTRKGKAKSGPDESWMQSVVISAASSKAQEFQASGPPGEGERAPFSARAVSWKSGGAVKSHGDEKELGSRPRGGEDG